MVQKNEHHSFTGMQKDIAVSKHPQQYLYDARNIRLTQREDGSTLLAITNERGPQDTFASISGYYLGHCLIDKYLVVFSKKGSTDYIDRFDLSVASLDKHVLFEGNLGFDTHYPIEAIGSYENEEIQKVYWTDGYNQPRIINIAKSETVQHSESIYTNYDFVPELALNETVEVQKLLGGNGMFAPGVIQYAFTYYHKYGQESNIFYTTPLYYISFRDRGASPEDKVVENAFKITVKNVDTNFEYLRIYSIQRTSINGTPITKRVQDISLDGITDNTVSFIDTGTIGDTIDPTELLYKGGESIVASTIEQKDGTLFLGGIKLTRDRLDFNDDTLETELEKTAIEAIKDTLDTDWRFIYPMQISKGDYMYGNQLTSYSDSAHTKSTPCGGFKCGNYYRLGIQFQYKTGKWGEPLFIDDKQMNLSPYTFNDDHISIPCFKGQLPNAVRDFALAEGYKKVRPVVVFPELQDRLVICQGVSNPTMYTSKHRNVDFDLYAQSSWFFRPLYNNMGGADIAANGSVYPKGGNALIYTRPADSPNNIRAVEIQGTFSNADADDNSMFIIDRNFLTLHSPDVEFDEDFLLIDYSYFTGKQVGSVEFKKTLSDIDIQTETPTISSSGSGFIHKSFSQDKSYGIVSGLFYDDFIVDENRAADSLTAYPNQKSSAKWMVYLWNKNGSLNNDINRPANLGTASAILKKKVISNLRYTSTTYGINLYTSTASDRNILDVSLFHADQLGIIKLKGDDNSIQNGYYHDRIYMGNIDTLLNPDIQESSYFAFGNGEETAVEDQRNVVTDFTDPVIWKTYSEPQSGDPKPKDNGIYKYNNGQWSRINANVGDSYIDLAIKKEGVRMKYKSTPHLIFRCNNLTESNDVLPIIDIIREDSADFRNQIFGGKSADAFKANVWIPCGNPVILDSTTTTAIEWSWGDTYYQRWDCLKTYAFTPEDINQVVEIGSFMLETYTNIDGRYDRNRGQLNNLNMSPKNFNLFNPVYNQINNFFQYRILDDDFYNLNKFPNQITWTKEKQAGADTDLWTNITLASTYDMDGSKGEVISLNAWRDQIFCFQNKGISAILFNSRVQIPTSDGTPIEISNNYKVDGYRYISDGIGCSNKWTIKETPEAVYFIDSVAHHFYSLSNGLQNLTLNKNMGSWFNYNNGALILKTLYDDVHHDVYLIKDDEALCYSEILNEFTSFLDYKNLSLMESYNESVYTVSNAEAKTSKTIYEMFKGDYNTFPDGSEIAPIKPWYITFVSNGSDAAAMDFDKIFGNIDYRLDFFSTAGIYDPDTSFDFMRAWNEYQDTQEVFLSTKNDGKGWKTAKFYSKDSLQKKFRIWRIQIPRAKKLKNNQYVLTNDRIRNPWCKITLGRKNNDENQQKAILQDLNIQYYL